ncbi:MAG: hypothetical protein J6U20_09515 [Fibrobacter sp.]|nr:hypothetical protein [Fibrobacter sp.]
MFHGKCKTLRSPSCALFGFVCALLCMMAGCSSWSYDYYKTTSGLNRAKIYLASWDRGDSAVVRFAESESLSVSFYFQNYEPLDKSLADSRSNDASQNIVLMEGGVSGLREPLSLRLMVAFKSDSNARSSGLGGAYVDIFGCSDYGCKKASKVVLHDEFYEYSRVIEGDDFSILESTEEFYVLEHGYDCDVTKEYHFRLKIDQADFKLDADLQKGEETCYERDLKCLFC